MFPLLVLKQAFGDGSVEYTNGRKIWRINGKLHRDDGPAVEWEDLRGIGPYGWWIDNRRYETFEDWFKQIEKLKIKTKEELTLVKLKYG